MQIQKMLLAIICDFEGFSSGHLISTSSPCSFSMFIQGLIFRSQSAVLTVPETIIQVAGKESAFAFFDVYAGNAQCNYFAPWLTFMLEGF